MRRWGIALAALAACGGSEGMPEPPAWDPALPGAEVMGERRGLAPLRGIIHLHSPYSHDACDGEPRDEETGAVDEGCLSHLREALCATRIDYAALTDHDATMADEELETLFSLRDDDELVAGGTASRMTCPGGHQVLITVGGENDLMPIMLDAHVPGTVEERRAVYNAEDPAAVAALRDAGALVWIPHTESRDLALLRELEPDGIEIYQLHANIDPDIRADHLGLPSAGAIQAVAEFADTNESGPEPDLALLSFLEENQNAVGKWDTLLGEGMRVAGSGGTDAHENALPITLRDGERGDSYRRMIRWFSNVALAPVGETGNPAAIEAAVAAGRFFVAFELFGTPVGFDFHAAGVEMGGEVSVSDGATLTLALPEVWELADTLPAPEIRGRILRVDAGGVTEIAAGSGETVTAAVDAPGAYRAEVLITPHHRGPYLGHLGTAAAEREQVWIYTNPIYAVP